MAFQTPITISDAIRNIESNRYLLPSIQREFEWHHEKIEWLFDSIMRNYPISSFLLWRVEGDTKTEFKFYQFIRDYRQRYKTHNEEFNTIGHNDFTAILDGQQRLTSLYIGLRGSYAYKKPRYRDEDTERAYPTRHLYLNIEAPLSNEEDGRIYEFKFLSNDDIAIEENEKWFKVSTIYGLSDDYEFNKYLDLKSLKSNEFSYRTLSTLKNVIHSKQLINYFLETEQNIDKALNIFIRINSGGEPLSFSDLLMSIAVANWNDRDARKEIHKLTDSIMEKGFNVSKDFILKTFLYLHSKDIKFKVTNFSKENAKEFEKEWDKIRDTILTSFDLMQSYGFNDKSLTSKNVVIPIIYYLYHRNIYSGFTSKIEHANDRNVIRKWIHTALVKRLFGATTDTVLSQIRKAFSEDVSKSYLPEKIVEFPTSSINRNIKKDMGITDEFIDDLLLTQKDDQYAFSILAILFPNLNYKNGLFHKDHLHPESMYDQLSTTDKEAYGWQAYNSICNLQLLDGNENQSKNGDALKKWVDEQSKMMDKNIFLLNHFIPDINLDISNFGNFFTERRLLLKEKLNDELR